MVAHLRPSARLHAGGAKGRSHCGGDNMARRTTGFGRSALSSAALCTLAALTVIPPVSGCREKRESTTVRELVGTVEEIDLNARKVKVKAYIEKHEAYETFLVDVTDETEILINGSLATLKDVREGERAEGRVRVTKHEGKTQLTALAVSIERGEVLAAPGTEAAPPPGGAAPAAVGTTGPP
jgi:hypothetical protein